MKVVNNLHVFKKYWFGRIEHVVARAAGAPRLRQGDGFGALGEGGGFATGSDDAGPVGSVSANGRRW